MNISLDTLVTLIHQTNFGTLATHSAHLPGYPFATVLPFVPDERHRPVFLMSRLAEHTKNVVADARASFLVFDPLMGDVLGGPRLTMVGDLKPFVAGPPFIARYVRYQPQAENYLSLGDFAFFRMEIVGMRMIAGFGAMGWIEATRFLAAAELPTDDEQALLGQLEPIDMPDARLLGVDRYGVDFEIGGRRARRSFSAAPLEAEAIVAAVRAIVIV